MAVIQYPNLELRSSMIALVGCTPPCVLGYTSISYQTPRQFLALSIIPSGFLAFYRPGLRDWGPVNGTQTGISISHSINIIKIPKKIDISSSLSCNPSSKRLDSAFSPTW